MEQPSTRDALVGEAIEGSAFAEALAETTQSLVCVLDPEGRILLFNDACETATGFTRAQVAGRDARDVVIPPEEVEAFGDVLRHVWTTGHGSPQVGHWLTADGGRRLIAWSNKPVLGDDGAPLYLVTTGLDITDRERAAEGLRSLEGYLDAKLAEVGRLAQEQRGLRRVATLVASEATPQSVFVAVSEECARVLGVDASAVFRYEPNGTATVVGRYDRAGVEAFTVGTNIDLDENTTVGLVHATGAPARIDDYSVLPGETARTMVQIGYNSTVSAPIVVGGAIWGAVAVATKDRLPPESEARLGDFCELVSLAVASAQTREELQASRARIVQAGDDARRLLERNLHDGAQQRLVALSLTLRLARDKALTDPARAKALLDGASTDLEAALDELRELARGLHPAVLSDRGLTAALESLADRTPTPVDVEAPSERLPEQIEAAVYYVAAEALTNVAKHADATQARISVHLDGSEVVVEIEDDGRGGAAPGEGSGIVGLRDRAEALGGKVAIDSPAGRGTVVRVVLPLGG